MHQREAANITLFFHSHRENNTSLVMIFIPIHEIVYRRTKNIPKQEYCIQMYQVAILKSPLKSRSDFLLGKMMGFSISAISFGELLDPPTSESLKSSSSLYYRLAVVLKVFLCSPLLGEIIQFDLRIFLTWVG